MNEQIEMIKGFGASAIGFAAWAISAADFDTWVGRGAAFGGFVLVWLTIIFKIKNWTKRKTDDL